MADIYYVPKLEDIRAGYICQWNTGNRIDQDGNIIEGWMDWVIGTNDDNSSIIIWVDGLHRQALRSQYITIEQIVALGWEDVGAVIPIEVPNGKEVNLRKFARGHHWMIYDFVTRVVMIAISMGDVHSVCVQRYDCPSVNELIYISSRLNLY